MNVAGQTAASRLQAANDYYNRAHLTIYSGTQPSTPETNLSGNTDLVSWDFAQQGFPTPVSATVSTSKVSSTSNAITGGTPANSGTASFGRCFVWAWTAATVVAPRSYCVNGGNLYYTAAGGTTAGSGGPTGTTTATDNTVSWTYVSAANTSAGHVVADYSVGTSGTDITLGTTTISIGTSVTLSTVTNTDPAV